MLALPQASIPHFVPKRAGLIVMLVADHMLSTHENKKMKTSYSTVGNRLVLLAFAALLSTILAGCATAEETRRANLGQDTDTCASFGARYGSSQHSECMLAQQNRRDTEMVNALEQARLSTEITNTNQQMAERRRCTKEAKRDREEGRRPRSCR